MPARASGIEVATVVTVAAPVLGVVASAARQSYPDECCGFLFGRWNGDSAEIASAQPVRNVREENRRRRFEITPADFAEAEAYAEDHALDLLGVYHSHPDHPAEPSRYDLERALPGFLYFIVSVRRGEVADGRWWELKPDRTDFLEATQLRRSAQDTE
jgi:proteasome lid subunit RPN8/RPN11